MSYIDHFAKQPSLYLQFRPHYPDGLYQYLSRLTVKQDLAWDCGTGNGQAAIKLAEHFNQVIGSDINQSQLDVAFKKDNLAYFCWAAEKTGLADHSVDLITIAQALHWFKLDAFYKEVRRVGKYNGIVAAWCYSLGKITDEIDSILRVLYSEILGDVYWPKERRYIDEEYQTIPFPFKQIEPRHFNIEKKINFTQLLGYLDTWSAVKEYQQINQENPIHLIFHELQTAWGDPTTEHTMQWPLHLLVGRII